MSNVKNERGDYRRGRRTHKDDEPSETNVRVTEGSCVKPKGEVAI